MIGIKDSTLLTVEKLNAWNSFSKSFNNHTSVDAVIAVKDLQKLVKNERKKQFDLIPFIKDSVHTQSEVNTLRKALL